MYEQEQGRINRFQTCILSIFIMDICEILIKGVRDEISG